jgi:hypothetical protein
MRISSHVCAAALVLSPVFFGACGGSGSTAPVETQTAAQLAARFDSMYVSWWARATTCQGDYAGHRACDMYFVELAPAYGVLPVDVSVSYNGNVEQWKGVEIEELQSSDGVAFDTTYWVAAYSTADLQHYLIAFQQDGSLLSFLFVDDSTELHNLDGTFATTATPATGTCQPVSGLVNPLLAPYAVAACTPMSFTASLSVQFFTSVPGPTPVATVSINGAHLSGERFVTVDTSTAAPRRVNDAITRLRGLFPSVDSPPVAR